jgi:uncharacterized iron-regulated membrane protein
MSYDELIRDTDNMVRKIMIQNDIVLWTLSAMLMVLMVLLGWWAWKEHQEKMRQLRDQREWDEMQAAMNEPYYRRM